jgi:putative membrane protein
MNDKNRSAYLIIGILSLVVFVFLTWLIYLRTPEPNYPAWVTALPSLNAMLNGITAILLGWGFFEIKIKGNKESHKKIMICATVTSGLFLISYIVYHQFHGDTKFVAQGMVRPIYFFILISHILLSIPLVPLVFTTLWHAKSEQWEKHKKFARWTFPIWQYVSVTGVLIFVFLKLFN